MLENLSVIQVIQLIIAPAVMINACGLLLLGVNNKFSAVLGRIRQLNEEKRRYRQGPAGREFSVTDRVRLESVSRQLGGLMHRGRMLRNSTFSYFVSVALFVLSSMFIAGDFFSSTVTLRALILASFLAGMVALFSGILFSGLDSLKAYAIVQFEVRADD